MAKTKISEYSATAGSNTDINSINLAEGMAPSLVNNAIRQLMAQLKDFQVGTAGDNVTVGGNLAVTGTSTFGGAISAVITGGSINNTAIGATTPAAGAFTTLSSSNATITGGVITGITDLAVADGGTGASTAAGALNNLLPSQASANNKYLQSDGTNASWDAVSLSTADITGVLAVANGGTATSSPSIVAGTNVTVSGTWPNQTIAAVGTGFGDVIGPASATASNLAAFDGTTGKIIKQANTVTVVQGGTGISSGTSGGVLAYTAAGTLASSGVLAQYGVVLGGGAGAVPTSTAVGTATYVLTSNGSGSPPTFQAPAGGTSFTAKTTTYTAVAGDTLLVDTSAGSFTITLPASPSTGNTVYFQDSKGTWFTYPLTIGRNGQTIMGAAENFTASSNNAGFGLVYNGSDWRVY